LKNDPLEKVVLPKQKKTLPVFVREDSLENLLDNDNFGSDFKGLRNRTIIEMLYLTGMRRAELIGLQACDIDFSASALKVTGKRNKQRIIPLTNQFIERVKEYLHLRNEIYGNDNNSWLFITEKGNKLYDKSVYNIVKSYLSMVTTI